MKTIQSELERIQQFLKDKIRDENYRMVRDPDEGDEDAPLKLERPRVFIGNIPHTNFALYASEPRFYKAPYLLVGYDTGTFHPDNEEIGILIQGCTYTAANYEDREEDDVDYPDNMGVLDITQMLEHVMGWIRNMPNFPAGMEYEIGNYGTQAYTYPYNFGYLAFQLKTNVGATPRINFF